MAAVLSLKLCPCTNKSILRPQDVAIERKSVYIYIIIILFCAANILPSFFFVFVVVVVVVGKVDCRCYGWRLLSRLIVVVNCWWRTWVVKSTCHPSIAIPTYVFSAETNKNFTKIEDMKTPLHNLRGCFLRNCLLVMVLVCSGCFLHQPRPRIYFEYWQIPNVGTSISLGLPHFTLNHHLKLPRKTVQPPKPNHFATVATGICSDRSVPIWVALHTNQLL